MSDPHRPEPPPFPHDRWIPPTQPDWSVAPVVRPRRRRRSPFVPVLVAVAVLGASVLGGVTAGALLGGGDAGPGAGPGVAEPVLAGAELREPEGLERIRIVGGDDDDPTQRVIRTALADVDDYWRRTYPQVVGRSFRSVTDFVAADGVTPVPCTDDPGDLVGNAFYCPSEDVIAWDARQLLPAIRDRFGDLGVALVMAHEYAHAVQARAGIDGPVIFLEQQADCLAGAWVADVRDARDRSFAVDGPALDTALGGFLALRDQPGVTAEVEPGAHGSAFDRIRAFQEGVEGGATACLDYTVGSVRSSLVALPFTTEADYASGGNLPVDEAFESMTADLDAYWDEAAAAAGARSFRAPEVTVFDAGDAPSCERPVGSADLFFCPGTNTVAVQRDGASVRAAARIGDFALGALLGRAWAAAVLDAGAGDPADARAADCLAGAWTGSVFAGDRPDADLSLSPGDLDEAVAALLGTSRSREGAERAAGFERVTAYRQGFTDGPAACLR